MAGSTSPRLPVQDTELKFDLVSPVDELAKQIRMEFDFVNEAEVMDSIAESLQVRCHLQVSAALCNMSGEPSGYFCTHLAAEHKPMLTWVWTAHASLPCVPRVASSQQ